MEEIPSPPVIYENLWNTGYSPYQLVQDFLSTVSPKYQITSFASIHCSQLKIHPVGVPHVFPKRNTSLLPAVCQMQPSSHICYFRQLHSEATQVLGGSSEWMYVVPRNYGDRKSPFRIGVVKHPFLKWPQ